MAAFGCLVLRQYPCAADEIFLSRIRINCRFAEASFGLREEYSTYFCLCQVVFALRLRKKPPAMQMPAATAATIAAPTRPETDVPAAESLFWNA